jgi:hypothetical protein
MKSGEWKKRAGLDTPIPARLPLGQSRLYLCLDCSQGDISVEQLG